jgi:hypothetical protein
VELAAGHAKCNDQCDRDVPGVLSMDG